jgi:predicted transcriptional regulator
MYKHKIKESITEKNLLKILSDKQARDILIYLIDEPRTITDISKKFDIPKSTAYRRIHELEDLGLVKVAGSIINEKGRRSYVYISKVSSVNLSVTSDGLILDIRPNKLKIELLSLSHI